MSGANHWTDGFGVLLNLPTLGVLTSNALSTTRATQLVQTVHDTLGRTGDGTRRLPDASDAHPLAGGLRAGKETEEDDPGGDGNGQYHHYLTMSMFALDRVARATGEQRYDELAHAIYPRFVRDRDAARPRMCWKMSVDLSQEPRPDRWLRRLQPPAARTRRGGRRAYRACAGERQIQADARDKMAAVCVRPTARSNLDMMPWTAHRFDGEEPLATELAKRAAACLRVLCEEEKWFDAPARHRLACREFGACLGARCSVPRRRNGAAGEKAHWEAFTEKALRTFAPGLDEDPSLVPTKLQPVTIVMYVTALIPGAFGKGFFD
ncbi:hypothetical protein BD413DRAFT_616351 [Trametes elegans]|nr:hypothetical protein BD413DRAFT_616351 [Trametes elegans]